MSIVGTRPPTLDEWNKYELHHRARLAIKPGITGMWQVSGRSEITDFEEVVKLDTEYISEWNVVFIALYFMSGSRFEAVVSLAGVCLYYNCYCKKIDLKKLVLIALVGVAVLYV